MVNLVLPVLHIWAEQDVAAFCLQVLVSCSISWRAVHELASKLMHQLHNLAKRPWVLRPLSTLLDILVSHSCLLLNLQVGIVTLYVQYVQIVH